jgi:hypothetical protein
VNLVIGSFGNWVIDCEIVSHGNQLSFWGSMSGGVILDDWADGSENERLACIGPNISGDVNGPKVTLQVPTGKNNEHTATFVGELDQREIAIAGTWQLTDDAGKRDGKFAARKRQSSGLA